MAKYYVEVVNRPYANRIPDDEWKRVSSHRSPKRAAERLRRESKWRTDGNSWSGHTRVIDDEGNVYFDDWDYYEGLHLRAVETGVRVL